jgi:hypothetical protein
MVILLLLLAALVVLGIVLAVAVVKWLFILAVVAALCWIILFARLEAQVRRPLQGLLTCCRANCYEGVCGSWSPMWVAGTCSTCCSESARGARIRIEIRSPTLS